MRLDKLILTVQEKLLQPRTEQASIPLVCAYEGVYDIPVSQDAGYVVAEEFGITEKFLERFEHRGWDDTDVAETLDWVLEFVGQQLQELFRDYLLEGERIVLDVDSDREDEGKIWVMLYR